MKVLLNTPDLRNPGGVAHYYRCVRPHLGANVDYFSVGTRESDIGNLRRAQRVLRDYAEFYGKLKNEPYDVVHLNPSLVPKAILRDALFLLIAKAFRKKVVVFMRGWDSACERLIRQYFRLPFRLVYSNADALIVLGSEFETKLIEMGVKTLTMQETTVVADSVVGRVDVEALLTQRAAQENFRILYLSRIEKTKGVYLALDTFRLLRGRYPAVTMTIAGDGREAARARDYAKVNQIDGVEFTGYLDGEAKHAAFSRAHVYFFPTFHGEGMPNSVLEAMAYGLPIVSRPVGGMVDFFEEGKMGFLSADSSAAVFVDLMERLILDRSLRWDIGRRNHKFIVERCLASSVAARLEAIYTMVACGRAAEAGIRSV